MAGDIKETELRAGAVELGRDPIEVMLAALAGGEVDYWKCVVGGRDEHHGSMGDH